MHWKDLVKVALLGTERTTLSSEVVEFLKKKGIDPEKEPTQVLLEAAALYSQLNKAGFPLKIFSGELPPRVDEDDKKPSSPKSSHHLKLILDGNFSEALPEFIYYLNRNKKQFPPTSLPDLLEQCKEDATLWEKLRPAIGKRGQWLMAQNPEWAGLISKPSLTSWQPGGKEERLALLKYLREKEPTKALELLQSTWSEESVGDRIGFLKIFETGLSKKDEDFLEDCLYDKRKEVRRMAAGLLSKIPDSELVKRMVGRVSEFMKLEKGILEITLSDELDETAKRDGIVPISPSYKSGMKAGWFGQMMAKVPPGFLEDFFGKSPSEILKIFARNDWPDMLFQAVTEATVLHKNGTWMEAILEWSVENEEVPFRQISAMKALLEVIPDALFNRIAIRFLEKNKGLLEENSPVSQLLKSGKHNWDDRLTLLVIKRFQAWLCSATAFYWNAWHYKKLLHTAAFKCNPGLYHTLKSGWDRESPTWTMWEPEVEQFLRVLAFRKEMIVELEK